MKRKQYVNTHIQFEITKSKRDFMGTTPAEYFAVGKCNDTNWNIPPYIHIYLLYACLSECIVYCKQVQPTLVLQMYSSKFRVVNAILHFVTFFFSFPVLTSFSMPFRFGISLSSRCARATGKLFETILMRKHAVSRFFFCKNARKYTQLISVT